ncbi:PA14 domain-containing protein [Streptomyces sp. NPDC001536]|uniref:PA14 domain-containing protein n=1 Tax=Streptomyces sp. NPDC001536 TaxID=3364583 RepID=UPI003684D6F2
MNRHRHLTATAVVLTTAGTLLTITPASAATTCTSPVFKRQLFANTTFSGTPKKTDCDSTIDQSWSGAPASGLPSNNFGVRWSVTRDFGSGGPFTLAASGLDGIRVYVDGTRKIDLWKNTSTTVSKTVNVTIPSGKHTLRVDYANWTGSAKVKFGYTPRTSATVDKVKPLAPTGTSATYDAATGKAKLTWAKNKEMDLAGYKVYRRLKGTSFGATPLATTTGTSYTDATLPVTGEIYYYEVRAHDKAGNASAGTADQAVTTVDRTAPAVPADVQVTSQSDKLALGWSASQGATSYRVYRAASATAAYSAIGITGTLSYQDTTGEEGVTYYYRVAALDTAGNESARSAAVSSYRRDDTPPSPVTGLAVRPTEYGFALKWDANPTADLHRYVVYAGDVIGDEEEQVCSVHEVEWLSTDTTSYDYATLPDGEERCFFIDSVDDNWNSHWQFTRAPNIVPATELDTTPSVATPEGSPLTVEASGGEGVADNSLTWSGIAAGADQEAGGYRVYRWNPATGAYEKLADLDAAASSYVDTDTRLGTTTYYWVTAVAADGTESLPAGDWTVRAPNS